MVKKTRQSKRPKKSPPPSIPPQPPSDGGGGGGGEKEEVTEYHAIPVALMCSTPAHFDDVNGEPATIVTVAKKDSIEPLLFTLDDTRKLVTKLLVSLATFKDEHANKVLEGIFPADRDDDYIWPGQKSPDR